MSIIDKTYDAVDDFDMITSAEARELGLRGTELTQQAKRGKLARVTRGYIACPFGSNRKQLPTPSRSKQPE